jgi:hypothetical protein
MDCFLIMDSVQAVDNGTRKSSLLVQYRRSNYYTNSVRTGEYRFGVFYILTSTISFRASTSFQHCSHYDPHVLGAQVIPIPICEDGQSGLLSFVHVFTI